MTDTILPFHGTSLLRRAKTIRELARQRHIDAVRELELGRYERYRELLRDVSAHEEEATRLERQAARVEEMRRGCVEAIDGILRRARA